jgi:hypothetical protein
MLIRLPDARRLILSMVAASVVSGLPAEAATGRWSGVPPLRSDTRFAYDSGTSDGFWLESRGVYRREDDDVVGLPSFLDVEVDLLSAEERIAWPSSTPSSES